MFKSATAIEGSDLSFFSYIPSAYNTPHIGCAFHEHVSNEWSLVLQARAFCKHTRSCALGSGLILNFSYIGNKLLMFHFQRGMSWVRPIWSYKMEIQWTIIQPLKEKKFQNMLPCEWTFQSFMLSIALWWLSLLSQNSRSLKQEGQKFEASLGNSSHTLSQNTK